MIFDLWNTLAAWPDDEAQAFFGAAGIDSAIWAETSDARWTVPLAEYLSGLGLGPDQVAAVSALRRETTRRLGIPVAGALGVLDAVRDRGLRLGLISNCSSEVAELWPETEFGSRFDVAVFSAQAGVCKPDPRIYRLALEGLGVEARDAVFVGDGGSDELAGAERVGMRAVQVGSRDGWDGERIETLDGLLALLPNGGER